MKTLGVCSVDAGQAYEEIPHDYVSRSTLHLINKFGGPASENKTLTVYNQQTVVAHKGGSLSINLSDRVVLRLKKIQEVVDMILGLRNYALGNATLSQTIGIPIGGPLSTVLLDIPLSCSEHHFDLHTWPPIAKKLGIPDWSRAETFTAARFADNTFSASPWLCASCLAKLLKNVYMPFIHFDVDTEFFHIQNCLAARFLDTWFTFGWWHTHVGIAPVVQNELMIWLDDPSKRKKTRTPIVCGSSCDIVASLRQFLAGRFARFRQIRLQKTTCVFSFVLEYVECLQNGYSVRELQQAVGSLKLHDFVYASADTALSYIFEHYNHTYVGQARFTVPMHVE